MIFICGFRVGALVCSTIRGVVANEETVVLKWPNDVLIGNDKVRFISQS